MPFRATLVSRTPTSCTVQLKTDATTLFGRGQRFNISDRRISRKHAEITVSSASRSVTIRPLSIVPSYVLRRSADSSQGLSLPLEKDVLFELKDSDKIVMLNGQYEFMLQIEDDLELKESEENFSEDATQLDLEALEEIQRRNNMSTKRYRMDEENSILKRIKVEQERPHLTSGGSAVMISSSELEIVRTIGIGSCGEVYEASWRGTRVAVKKIFRTLLHGNALKEFQMESDMLRRLRHPSIVLWMGTCMQGRDMCIVTEFIERGSLRQVLSDESIKLDWNTVLSMAVDAARGMNYLHTSSPPIIHRDLKSYNLLVDKNFRVKVTDFGLAKYQVDDKVTTFCGTLPWTAPEVFKGVGYSEKCDIYSFSIVLWELLTRKEPYNGMNKPDIIVGVTQGLRPPIPEDCSAPYAQLMTDCWMDEPTKRPTFTEILHRLEQLQQMTESKQTKEVAMGMSSPMNITHQFRSFQDSVHTNTWEIEPNELVFKDEISEGTSATVYKGSYRGQQVAIKVLKEAIDGKHKEDFKKELEVMNSLRSPSVVFFYGATLKPQLAIVTELLPNGSLYDVMARQDIKCDWELVIKLCMESASAINTLHCWKPSVVHRDIKPQHLLVDQNWSVKVTGFGFARFHTNENSASLSKLKGSYLYAAPEAYLGSVYTAKSDVYSFGIILWELVTRCITGSYKKPYFEHKNLKDFQIVIQTAKKGLRPVIHSTCPPPFADLMRKCWDQDPDKRPQFQDILLQLKMIKQIFEQERQNNIK